MSKKFPVSIDEEEVKQLLRHTLKKKHRLAFLLGFASGLRISEILNLEPRDINFKEKTILVRQGKGKKDRIVPLPKSFREDMIKYLPLKFKNNKSGSRSLEKAFKSAAGRANLLIRKPTLHFHSLRHGFGSRLAGKGVPIHHIRTLMGHSNISTTNIYLEANPKEALKEYDELF